MTDDTERDEVEADLLQLTVDSTSVAGAILAIHQAPPDYTLVAIIRPSFTLSVVVGQPIRCCRPVFMRTCPFLDRFEPQLAVVSLARLAIRMSFMSAEGHEPPPLLLD